MQHTLKTRPLTLVINTSPYVIVALQKLSELGLFGSTPVDVAESLLREKLRELELQGWLKDKAKR